MSLQVAPTDAGAGPTDHARMKETIEDATGLSFSMQASVVSQMGAPGGTVSAIQAS